MRKYADTRDWVSIEQLPLYAPDLNSGEGIWLLLRRDPLANVAFTDDDHLERTRRRGLRRVQHRPHLIDGCLSGTGTHLHLPSDNTLKRSVDECTDVCIEHSPRPGTAKIRSDPPLADLTPTARPFVLTFRAVGPTYGLRAMPQKAATSSGSPQGVASGRQRETDTTPGGS